MQVGNRIVYDQDGEIIFQAGEMQGDVLPRKDFTNIQSIDIPFGAIDYSKFRIVKVNVETRQAILEEIQREQTPEERIQELENQLLLAEDANVGGIL